MKILFIGSDREIVEMTAKILRRSDYDVTCALGEGEALARLTDGSFELVILDCDMRSSERDRLIRGIKQSGRLLLAISENREDEVPLLKSGADDWMHKPYHMDVLLVRMVALLRQAK